MHFWPKFGNTDFNLWWLIARTSSKWGKFWLLSSIWPWSSRSIISKNNRDLNQGLLHLWSKFGDSSLNGWWVTARTSWWLTDRHTHTHTHTHAGNDNTRRPKLASGKNDDIFISVYGVVCVLLLTITVGARSVHTFTRTAGEVSHAVPYVRHVARLAAFCEIGKEKVIQISDITRIYIQK